MKTVVVTEQPRVLGLLFAANFASNYSIIGVGRNEKTVKSLRTFEQEYLMHIAFSPVIYRGKLRF